MTRSALRTFAWPAALAGVTLGALLIGLFGSGVLDLLAVVALAAPLAVCAVNIRR